MSNKIVICGINTSTLPHLTEQQSMALIDKAKGGDQKAREDYRKMKERSNPLEGTFIIDIIRQQWRNDDERLR